MVSISFGSFIDNSKGAASFSNHMITWRLYLLYMAGSLVTSGFPIGFENHSRILLNLRNYSPY